MRRTSDWVRKLARGLAGTAFGLAVMAAVLGGCEDVRSGGDDSGAPRPQGPVVENAGFDRPGEADLPAGWSRDMQATAGKGQATRDTSRAARGGASLRLSPTEANDTDQPLAVSQIIEPGDLRGRTVEFSGQLAAEGGATALLGLLSLVHGSPRDLELIAQPANDGAWSLRRGRYDVPADASTQLVLIAMVNGQSGSAWFDDVSIHLPGERPRAAVPTREVDRTPLEATARVDANEVIRDIPRELFGANVEWRWNGVQLWQEHEDRVDPEVERLTRELGVTLIRYPGGIYSDYFHWRQAIGPRHERPMKVHEPGRDDRSRPLFGPDEAQAFARSIGGELMITVNAGTGTAEEAAAWVRYMNRDGLKVRYWEVGNELYIADGTPFAEVVSIGPEEYAERFVEFARAMREADPRIRIGAIGGANRENYNLVSYDNWNEIVMQRGADYIDFFSVHNAYAPIALDDSPELRTVYRAMLAAPKLIAENLVVLDEQMRRYMPDRADQVELAVTEWGPFFHVEFGNRYIDHPKTLGSALFTASAFKALLESPRTGIAVFWMLNDFSVLGFIGSRSTAFPPEPDWAPTARYYALQMFTQHFGERLVSASVDGPTFDTQPCGYVGAVRGAPYLELVASLSGSGDRLYLIGINRHFDRPIDAAIDVEGFEPASRAVTHTLTGTGIDANTGTQVIDVPNLGLARQAEDAQNPRFYQGGPNEVWVEQGEADVSASFQYRFAPHSVTSIMLRRMTTD